MIHNEPIISRELWDKCQEILTIRSKIIKPDGNRDKFSRKYAFSSTIFCGICGERFIRRSYKIRSNGKEVAYWICRSHRNKIECSNLLHYKQEELEDIFVLAYNKLFQDSDKYINSLEILNQKNLQISNKIKEYEQQLKDTENIEITQKQKLEQIDKIIIGEKSGNGKEDFYNIKFILKTGQLINKNLPNGKLDIGTNFGKYGFTITKQELKEK